MDHQRFIHEVRAHIGPADDGDLDEAVQATLAALGAMVGHTHRQAIAGALPEELSRPFRDAHYDRSLGREALVARVAESEHIPEGRALEHATAVLAALGGSLEEDVRHLLESELPQDVRRWVRPKRESRPSPGNPDQAPHTPAHHLSDARPGSRHPVSESGAHEVHSNSVAASPDPHADTRLSSARGTTQERERDTIAQGAPGGTRPVSEGE